jgi:ferredoxin-NADP reductase
MVVYHQMQEMIQTYVRVVAIEYSSDRQVAQIFFEPEEKFVFLEGQFVFLERLDYVTTDGKSMKRAYSIGSTNALLQDTWVFSTVVKKSSEDGMSHYLTQDLQLGDRLQCIGPLGKMINTYDLDKYLFVSIGSGITPLHSLYLSLQHSGNFTKIAYIFGERYASSLLDSLVRVYNKHDATILHKLYLSKEDVLPDGRESWYVQQWLEEAISFLAWKFQVFLCGKPEMVDDITNFLLDKWVGREMIHSEKY